MKKIAIIKQAIDTLKEFEVPMEVRVMSAHRTPDDVSAFAKNAREEGFGAIIAAAGKAAHLAGVIAAYTTLPVIGIPIKSSTLDGLDALLSTVQMPGGVPVATVAIDGAKNAALLAIEMLAIEDADLERKFIAYREKQSEEVRTKNSSIDY